LAVIPTSLFLFAVFAEAKDKFPLVAAYLIEAVLSARGAIYFFHDVVI
jgi:hypothetical protein